MKYNVLKYKFSALHRCRIQVYWRKNGVVHYFPKSGAAPLALVPFYEYEESTTPKYEANTVILQPPFKNGVIWPYI